MKKLFLRFALLTGLFLVGFIAPAMADENDVHLTLNLAISEYTGNAGGKVAVSDFYTSDNEGSVTRQPKAWGNTASMYMPSEVRAGKKYNMVDIYAKANEGYTFSYWADADSKLEKPSKATFGKEVMIYDGLWGYYIKRELCKNPGDLTSDYYGAVFHYHVYGTFLTDHKDSYTLYAVFEPNQYVVTLMDGETEFGTKNVKYHKAYGSLPTPEKTGYTFDGWFTETTGGTQVHAADVYSTLGDQTLYAHWSEQTYKIHFVDNEYHHAPADATYRVADGHMPALPTSPYQLSEPGKYFAGYYTKLNGAGDRVYAGYADGANLKLLATEKKLTSDITLYAHYSHVHHDMYWDYTYIDHNQAGNPWVTMGKTDVTDRIQYARLTFNHANGTAFKSVILYTANPDNKTVAPTQDFSTHTTALANIHLYIGESTPSGTKIVKSGDGEHKVYFTDEELSDFHSYTFEAISNTKNAQDEYVVASNWTVTTEKSSHNTILTFSGSSAENSFSQSWSVTLDGLLINPDVIYVMPLFASTFEGGKPATWAAISQIAHTSGVPCMKASEEDGKATYNGSYLVWKESTYAIGLVGFNLGGQDYWMNTTHPGEFADFYNSANYTSTGDGITVNPGTNPAATTGATTDLTIKMTVPASKIPVIRFLANGGVLGATTPSYLVANYGATVALKENETYKYSATRENYTFLGWKAVDGAEIITSLTANRAYTLEAQWEGKASTVTLHHNDGTTAKETVTANYMADMPPITAPTRTGYTFKGYWDVDDVKYYDENGASAHVYDKTADCDLYAGWEANTYTVSFNLNGATGTAPADQTATYGETLTSITAPAWLGHSFLGFFDGTGAEATKYIDATGHCIHAWDKATNATLYAHWETVEITITANKDPLHPSDYYTTFYLSSVAYQITTENVTIFIATRATDGKLYLEEVDGDVIPAGEAVLLQATQEDIHLAPVESAELKNEENIFEGVDEDTVQDEDYTYYVFGKSQADDIVGFYKYEWKDNDDATVKGKLNAHKAFFKAPKGSQQASAPRYVIHHTDVTTGMEAATMEKAAVRKMIVNGQLVIEHEGKLYNAQGVVIK